MKRLTVINIIVICVGVNLLSIISTGNVIQNNASCDIILDFSNMGLNIVNVNFISNQFIKNLSLSHNNISSFQEKTFDSLPSLEKLDLSNNELNAENLFSFGKVYVLKSLILDENPNSLSNFAYTDKFFDNVFSNMHRSHTTTTTATTPITPYFTTSTYSPYYRFTTESYSNECSEDQYRYMNECKDYTELKVTYEYPYLTHLSIRKIFINSLASDWANFFPKLTHLDISENYFHKTLDKVLNHLPTTITSLTMRNVKLTALVSSNLENITDLDLNENRFETLSSHYCYENTLCLRNLTNLESLRIADCSIKKIEIDAFRDAKKLNHLYISNNDFQQIPDGTFEFLPALSHLDLSSNKLSIMPNISNLKNLTSLYMDNIKNDWLLSSELEKFSKLPKLEILSLRSNRLTKIPSNFLNNLPRLVELNLSYNRLTTLPAWQWQNTLRTLSLIGNEIKKIEDLSLEEAGSLEFLNLQLNKFSEVKLKSLRHLPDNVILKF